jgi:hypothetical protein
MEGRAQVGLSQSTYPLEFWLAASTRGQTPAGIETKVRRVQSGATLELCLPKEPIPYFVHAVVELAGREPRFLAQTRRTHTEVRERYEFQTPCALFVYKWIEARFFDAAAGEPRHRSELYVCATEAQLERARAVVAELMGPTQPRPRAAVLPRPQPRRRAIGRVHALGRR